MMILHREWIVQAMGSSGWEDVARFEADSWGIWANVQREAINLFDSYCDRYPDNEFRIVLNSQSTEVMRNKEKAKP
jgi:hypothetical protein